MFLLPKLYSRKTEVVLITKIERLKVLPYPCESLILSKSLKHFVSKLNYLLIYLFINIL